MKESDRKQRNAIKLQELHPSIRMLVEAVLVEMESYGYRPRIQEAWRSVKDQLDAYNAGRSKVKFGFHNTTAPDGTKEALAADIWDDNRPFRAKTDFMLHLLAAAEKNDLTTGIRWNLSDDRIILIDEAIAEGDWKRPVWVGWDPLHVEVTEITVQEAESGKRPHIPGGPLTEPDEPGDKEDEKFELESIHYKVENLDTSRTYQYELKTTLRPLALLPVPYISRLGQRVGSSQNDFGSEAATMVLAAYTGRVIPPDALYDRFNVDKKPYLSMVEINNSLGSEGISAQIKNNLTIKDLFGYLQSNVPIIIPVNYSILHEAGLTEKPFVGPHFSVAVGIDLKNIYVHDSMFTDPDIGEAHAYPIDVFMRAWTDTPAISIISIPKRSAVIPSMALNGEIAKRVRVTADRLNVRQGPGFNYAVAFTVHRGDEFVLVREENAWGEISPGHWISLEYTKVVSAPNPTPKPDEDTPPVEPRPIPSTLGNGTLINVSLATSVPQNPEGPHPAQYLFKDANIPPAHRNLCGDIALSMVYETATKKKNALGYIYAGIKNTTRKPTAGSITYELAQQFAQTFPSGWKAHCHYLSYIYYFNAGDSHFLKESPGALKTSMTQKSQGELIEMISKMITDHTFVIAGVTINTKVQGPGAARLKPNGVGHWVAVTGFSNTHVYINNPFMNRREAYLWDEFLKSFVHRIVQIIPPDDFQPQVYEGPMDQVHASMEQDRHKT